ncbi:LuxR C-terminal-related transcriptional regulator [Achromobacter animicus]|uniref:response regulator transcription factor n=1 Tax=Achromobacter animicus TaxID=1389935 RepID=UPI0028B01C56|nr:LuxR C-terminal-related transcriptional regulator [Achromobacter animicus]
MPYSEQPLRWRQYQYRSLPDEFLASRDAESVIGQASALPSGSKAYIVDEDESSVWAVRRTLADFSIEVVQSRTVREFLSIYSSGECDCLIMDFGKAAADTAVQRDLVQANAALPTIFIKAEPEFGDAVEAMRRGAVDFFAKPLNSSRLCQAIHHALRLSRRAHLNRLRSAQEEARKAMLTPRELVIVQGVIAGHSSKEIAEHLHISVRTVDNHKARIYSKLNINTSLALARLFVGLIKPVSDGRPTEAYRHFVPAKR